VIEVRVVRGDDPAAVALLEAMEAEVEATLGPVTPETTSVVSAADLSPPSGAYVVLVEDGVVVGGGGVRRLGAGVGEIKRMWTAPEARGRGHGRRLLAALEDAARSLGYTRVRLDTAATMAPALALYRAAGYRSIPDYNGNGYAAFWGEKELGEAP
jgi:ribosomal protein S18 acetylase RimI-like enzyme